MAAVLDNPLFLSVAFHPRKAESGSSSVAGAVDGTIPVPGAPGIELGYRYHPCPAAPADGPLVLCFHGNAEIASDFDRGVGEYFAMGLSLMVVDFRGYGWSTGTPKLTTLTTDAEAVVPALAGIVGAERPVILFGRSIGSTCAVHLASTFPDRFAGLVLESALTDIRALPMVQQMSVMLPGGDAILAGMPDIFRQLEKLGGCQRPLLVLHGEEDELAPVAMAQAMHDASAAELKRLKRFPGAGHNDLLFVHSRAYFASLHNFVATVLGMHDSADVPADPVVGSGPPVPTVSAAERAATGAQRLFDDGRLEAAAQEYTRALRGADDDDAATRARLCAGRARCYARLGSWQRVVDDCTVALGADPDDAAARQLRLTAYAAQGQRSFAQDEAREQLRSVGANADPRAAAGLVLLGVLAGLGGVQPPPSS